MFMAAESTNRGLDAHTNWMFGYHFNDPACDSVPFFPVGASITLGISKE